MSITHSQNLTLAKAVTIPTIIFIIRSSSSCIVTRPMHHSMARNTSEIKLLSFVLLVLVGLKLYEAAIFTPGHVYCYEDNKSQDDADRFTRKLAGLTHLVEGEDFEETWLKLGHGRWVLVNTTAGISKHFVTFVVGKGYSSVESGEPGADIVLPYLVEPMFKQCLREARLALNSCNYDVNGGKVTMYEKSSTDSQACPAEQSSMRRCTVGFDIRVNILYDVLDCGLDECYLNYHHKTIQF